MKKSNYILLFTLFLTFSLMQAQEEKELKFDIIVYGGIGYGIVENDNEPNYNLNSNALEILVNYNINKKFGIATGIGLNELSGNGFNSIGNFYHERTLLKIPLLFTMGSNVTENLKLFTNFVFFGQNIINDEYRFLNETQKDIYKGWNFGAQFGFGFAFEMFDNYSIGINYNAQSDLSKFGSNNNAGINDKQKFTNLNSVGILFMIDL
jgi:opacity protein-like surface antigen